MAAYRRMTALGEQSITGRLSSVVRVYAVLYMEYVMRFYSSISGISNNANSFGNKLHFVMIIYVLSLLALSTALLHFFADDQGRQWLVYWAKPATTSFLLFIALAAPPPARPFYQVTIVAGLLFSLAGDIFLMLPSDRFLAGLVSFLLAHLCYIGAFALVLPTWVLSLWGLPVLFFAGSIYWLLRPHLGTMQLPVLLYMAIIVLMAWLAVTLFVQRGEWWTLSAAVGAILFVISDATLALNRFRKPFRGAQLIVLGTYYLAQWLIALSV